MKINGILFIVLLLLAGNLSIAQDIPVTKSKKTETIEGRKFYLHFVEKGQTLYGIAKAYEVSKNDIILENPELIDGLKENITIKIPVIAKSKSSAPVSSANSTVTTSASVSTSSEFKSHKVEQGQTLYSISKQYNVKIEEINALNPELVDGLKTGQTLKIPQKITVPLYTKPDQKETKATLENKEINTLPPIGDEDQSLITAPVKPVSADSVVDISLLLPLYLNANNDSSAKENEIYPKSLLGLSFYEGFKFALDSVSTTSGQSFKLRVLDTEHDSLRMAVLLSNPELKKSNFIVGPLYADELNQATVFSRKNGISLISPFSQSNKVILGNQAAIKIMASNTTQIEKMAEHLKKTYAGRTFYLVHNDNSKDKILADAYKRCFKNNKDSLRELVFKKGFGYSNLENLISSHPKSILIIPVNDQAFVTDLVNKLYNSKDTTQTIVGTENWLSFDNIEPEQFMKLHTLFPSSYFADFDNEQLKQVSSSFKAVYHSEPDKYALHGFDCGMYLARLISNNNASIGEKAINNKFNGVQTYFDLYRTGNDNGLENRNVYILELKNYKLTRLN